MATQNLHHSKIKTYTEEETICILWSQVRKRCWKIPLDHISSVQSLSRVRLFATPWTVAHQASLSITNSRSSLKLKSIESVMSSSHLVLCRPLLLLPPIPPSIRVFSNESTLRMRWPKYWNFSFSIIPFKEHPGLISFKVDHILSFNISKLLIIPHLKDAIHEKQTRISLLHTVNLTSRRKSLNSLAIGIQYL